MNKQMAYIFIGPSQNAQSLQNEKNLALNIFNLAVTTYIKTIMPKDML